MRITPGEQARRDECALEPIRTPGAVQPHGVLIVVADGKIQHVSANSIELLGFEPDWLLGRPLDDVLPERALEVFDEILDDSSTSANPVHVTIGDNPFDAIVHRVGDVTFVDIEPCMPDTPTQSPAVLYAAVHRLATMRTAAELWAFAATAVRRITEFDHVMVYHFHEDEHGEIVGEDLAEGMEPYLGLHYPASDIPAQARELYLSKLSRVIATTSAEPSALLSIDSSTLDLSQSELRSVSPRHLEFMRNMGQASTMSFSLISDDRLIGMITCAHRTVRRLPYSVRQGLEVLANQVALQLTSIASIEHLTRQVHLRSLRADIVSGLTEGVDVASHLLHASPTITDLIPADGAVVRHGGETSWVGHTPPPEQLAALIEALRSRADGLGFVSDTLAVDHPELAALVPSIAGAIVVPLGGEGDFVAWFRRELVQSISWLGDQTPGNRPTPLSPRSSFSAWTVDVTGTSASWGGLEADAVELGRDIDSVLFRRAESQLARLALHDPLTGLPNRRLLMDRLDHALTRCDRGEQLAILFIDLDGFKAINDSSGHEAGDAVLVRTAEALLATARTHDTVARIGGDEFVVLCEGTGLEHAKLVADRILDAVRDPASGITASVGIATASERVDAAALVARADTAMYRAKQRGRDQWAR